MKTLPFSSTIPLLVLAASFALAGCGTYRVVKRAPHGGEVALQGSPEKAREKADEYMASHCPAGYDVVEEGEAVIGSETTANTQRAKTIFGTPVQQTTSSTTDKREWRIEYQCKSTAADVGEGGERTQGRIEELVIRF